MARKLGQLETAALSLAHMRNLRTMQVGQLASGLRISTKQERELLSRIRIGSISLKLVKVARDRLGGVEKVGTPTGETLVFSSRARTLVDAVYDWSLFDSLPDAYDRIRHELTAGRVTADEVARATVQFGNMGTIRRIGVILDRIGASKASLSRLARVLTATTELWRTYRDGCRASRARPNSRVPTTPPNTAVS